MPQCDICDTTKEYITLYPCGDHYHYFCDRCAKLAKPCAADPTTQAAWDVLSTVGEMMESAPDPKNPNLEGCLSSAKTAR